MKDVAIFILLIMISALGFSQDDTAQAKERKNIIRWNLTPMAVIGPKSLVFGYQRVLPKDRSFSLNVGYMELRPFVNREGAEIKVFDQRNRGGLDITADFRFYFKNRNKLPTPDGLYWGPFASFYNLHFEGKSNVVLDGVPNTIGINTNVNMYSLGVQLGYQFIIKKRFSVDLILLGPSYTHYDFTMDFDAAVAIDPDSQFYQDFQELLSTLVPGSETILDGVEFNQSGRVKLNSFGFRYGIQVGYVF